MNRHIKAWSGIGALGALVAGIVVYGGLLSTIATTPGCDESSDGKCKLSWEDATLDDEAICAAGNFTGTSEDITNPFFPFPLADAGKVYVLEGQEDGATIRVVITVTGTTRTIEGVTTHVINEKEYEDGELVEDTDDWYAQADDGTVCYFGEAVDNYEDGVFVDNEGSWKANFVSAKPGIIMPKEADIAVGAIYIQERVPDVAADMSEIIEIGEAITTPVASYTDTFSGNDCNPLDREKSDKKIYARGVGIVYDNGIELQ